MKAGMIGGLLAVAVLAAAAMLASADTASADPLVYVSVLGRVAGSGADYSSSVAVQAGNTLEYQLWAEMASVGTHNSTSPGFTITSLAPGVDGINSLKFNLGEATNQPIQVDFGSSVSMVDGWVNGTGASGGTVTARGSNTHDIMNIRPFQGVGPVFAIFVGVPATNTPAPVLVGSGTALVTTLGSGGESVVRASYLLPTSINSVFVLGAQINGGVSLLGSTSDTDPILGFQDLHLTPEPATLALLAFGGLVAAWRRRATNREPRT